MVDTDDKTYIVRLTGKQLRALSNAAELEARIWIGQLGFVREVLQRDPRLMEDDIIRWGEVEWAFAQVKQAVFPGDPVGGGPAIHAPRVNHTAKVLFDLYEVFRHRLAWDRKPEGGMGVDFHEPMPISGLPRAQMINEPLQEALKGIQEGNLQYAKLKLQEALRMYEEEEI